MKFENKEEILSRYLSGECTSEEKKSFEIELNQSEEMKSELEYLRKIWNVVPDNSITQNPEEAWERFTGLAGIEKENISSSISYATAWLH